MKRTYSQLDLDERRKIERWRHAGVAVDVIAEKLGRHRSTIFREIARNKFDDAEMPELSGYFCVAANGKANRHRLCGCPHEWRAGYDQCDGPVYVADAPIRTGLAKIRHPADNKRKRFC